MRTVLLFFSACAAVAWLAAADETAPVIPLCPGLTIVTAITQQGGDYESIKTIESVDPTQVRVKYSSEALDSDLFSTGPPKVKKTLVYRNILAGDLASATSYQQKFMEKSAETIPGTTAIGTSAAVLRALKTKGEAQLTISNAYAGLELGADRNKFPSYYNYMESATIRLVGAAGQERVKVLVNDAPVDLPVVHAQGNFPGGGPTEFWFLDDEQNPLTLRFGIGMGAYQPLTPTERRQCAAAQNTKNAAPPSLPSGRSCAEPDGAARDTLKVIKITCPCGVASLPGGAGGQVSALEQALSKSGKVDIYSIYFSYNSDALREESEPALKEIAEVMRRHPDWKLRVGGHTDGVGGDQYNLDLSRRRAAAVKDALVKRFGIGAARLTTAGFGKSQPKATNDTLEGRALNRRVELVRQSG